MPSYHLSLNPATQAFLEEAKEEIQKQNLFSFHSSAQTLVSNEKETAPLFAPEINWYLKNSLDSKEEKLKTLSLLYEARAIKFDHALHQDYEESVSPSLLVIGESQSAKEFASKALESSFEVEILPYESIESIEGKLGAFVANLTDGSSREFAQGVLFREDEFASKYMGIEKVSDFEDAKELLEKLQSRLGIYRYKTTITYNPEICQYHHRREKSCSKCATLCPTFGVVNDDSKMELLFSQLDCVGCGGCISACPTGAIDYAPYPKEALYEIARLYNETTILMIPEPFLKDLEEVTLPKGITPLIIDREKFPSEMHLLTLLQESGSSLLFYSPIISRPTKEASEMLNQIYLKAYGEPALYLAQDIPTLLESLPKAHKIEKSLYRYTPKPNELRRKTFGERLRYIIKEQELGQVPSGDFIRYGEIKVDQEKCTLCLSCVGACNVNALTANSNEFTLDFNASLCTTCGYCLPSCPENAITLELSGITLAPSWFESKVMARDEMFKCIECGKPFATKKSVEKIKNLMSPLFVGNAFKLKTLECCPDCKVKVMMGFSSEADSKRETILEEVE